MTGTNQYVVISQSLANTFFRGEDPIGKRVRFDSRRAESQESRVSRSSASWVTSCTSLAERPQPTSTAVCAGQVYGGELYAVIHTAVEPHSLIAAARAEVGRADPDVAIDQVRTMEDILGESTADRRFHMVLFGAFAGLAMLLAAAGLYGVLSYGVSRRRGEIGLRMALGASGPDVRRLILRDGMRPALAGNRRRPPRGRRGMPVAEEPSVRDRADRPGDVRRRPLLLLGVSAAASYIPALRAARVDPTVTLRSD